MEVIARVRSEDPAKPLSQLLDSPLDLDLWEIRPDSLVLRADESVTDQLGQLGYAVELLEETMAYLATFATEAALETYHSAATLEQDLRVLAEQEPEIAELREIGRSVENRPIWALRLGERRGSTRKVLFVGCHHAREWISVEVPYLLAEHLVQSAHQSPDREWLSTGEIWIAPMINPDGHEFTRRGPQERLWRKNRRPNPNGTLGVDPNRNYGYLWGTRNDTRSSHNPAHDTYVGPRAFSEPETQAVRDLIGCELFRGVLSYHSYSQLILHPWGNTTEPIRDPADREQLEGFGERMQALIHGVHGQPYRSQAASALYPTAGDTVDWAYGVYAIPAYTIELRPDEFSLGGFILPPEEIRPTWEENQPAAREFIQWVLMG
jgi:carboxypeptidase T